MQAVADYELGWDFEDTATMLQYDPPHMYSAFKHLDGVFRPFKGMFCTVTGSPGAGKSRWSMHFACQMARLHDHRTIILSMEMLPHFVGKCIRAYTNAWKDDPDVGRVETNVKRMCPKHGKEPNVDALIAKLKKTEGVDWIIIDPWNQIEQVEKYKSVEQVQKDRLQQLANLANRNNVGIMVVTHPTKGIQQEDGKVREPTYYDIAGSAHWANRSDYVLCLRRNFEEGTTKFSSLKVRHQEEGLMPGSVNMRLSDKGLYVPV